MSGTYFKPASLGEALRLASENPDAAFIAGGTGLFAAGARSRKGRSYISVGAILPEGITVEGDRISLGAGSSFQDIVDSPLAPPALRAAAAGMATRNIRNRATVGGNIGADKSCASLLPFFLAAEARLVCADRVERSIDEWRSLSAMTVPARLILSVSWEAPAGRSHSYAKYSRTAADLSILTCAVCAEPQQGHLRRLRIALGGLGPHARRFPDLEAALEGALSGDQPFGKAEIEALAAPHFHPVDDIRGSAAFKRLRAAVLLADAIFELEARE